MGWLIRHGGVAALAFVVMCGLSGGASAQEPRTDTGNPAAGQDRFVRADGRRLVLDGKPFRIRAVNFSNLYHTRLTGPDLLASRHHAEEDFARVKDLGFNAIRFAMNGDWYVQFPEAFWKWLDRNVAWARRQDVRLVLDLHTPAGSFWLDPTDPRVNFAIWTDPEVRRRNIALWRDIAERYRDEPHIAAYDILNEPVTTDSDGKQWRTLAQDMVDAIRSVDRNHLIIVGGLYGVNGRYGIGDLEPHFLVDDGNVLYDFHFYEPVKYTHQYATWLEGPIADGGRYPDPQVILPTGKSVLLAESRITTPSIAKGTSEWTLYDSGPVAITDRSALAARPMIAVRGALQGRVRFDSMKVLEYDPEGTLLRVLMEEPLSRDGVLDWYPWQSGSGEKPAKLVRDGDAGHKDSASLSIAARGTPSSVAGWSSDAYLFRVKPGNRYRILGYMRGEDVRLQRGAAAGFEIDVYRGASDAPGKGFLGRDKAYLEYEMMKHLRFGIRHEVPMSVMEFGLVRQCFEMAGKGGRQWVADVIALMDKHGLSFAYWEYHGAPMGLYHKGTGGPGAPNRDLVEVLERELGGG